MSALRSVSLNDKYTLDKGQIILSGVQALARLPMLQAQFDRANGLKTGGFISGYRGSPLGGFDQTLWAAENFLRDNNIVFEPGINEDLGATAVWGSQQVTMFEGAKVDGVFAMWYGKGPGVDRSGDVFKHANAAGTAKYGGVLALMGDDHACKSSTMPHQSDYAMIDAMIPVIYPANVQDVLDLGIFGWGLSRYSGLWCGFKVISDTIDTSASVSIDPDRFAIKTPKSFSMPADGVSIRWPDRPHPQEARLHNHKLQAVRAFVKANNMNHVAFGARKSPRFGIVCAGKSYLDVRQALSDIGITESKAKQLGIAVYKVTVTWPLEEDGVLAFAKDMQRLVVVEEKRPIMENQLKTMLYHLPAKQRPLIYGKSDPEGKPFLPVTGELDAALIAQRLVKLLEKLSGVDAKIKAYWKQHLQERQPMLIDSAMDRLPFYCSGCPHNTSTTNLPEGSRALGGIGCHYMATWIDKSTTTFAQMGGEGVTWLGQAPFTDTKHIFANLGDGTYFHSGILAIRAAVAAKANITYKILYNDAVAMTGGQAVDGPISVGHITHQLRAEGVRRIAVVSENPFRAKQQELASGVTVHHRDELSVLQEDLRNYEGVSALIYDQTCAAELRRRRKRGLAPDPAKRIFINETVCEGCGDCGKQSNCLSITPLETEWGRKRAIDQSTCNKDYSCVKGFCPSFVAVIGGQLHKPAAVDNGASDLFSKLPAPKQSKLKEPYNIFVTGVGGTGVVTIGALMAMAAHIESKGVSVVDMAGLAQKGGAVVSHVRIADKPEDIHATRIANAAADLILGCDMVVTAGSEAIAKIRRGHTNVIANTHKSVTGPFTQDPDYVFPLEQMMQNVVKAAGDDNVDFMNATRIATTLLGDSIMMNIFLIGYGVQRGFIPLSPESLQQAIELNRVAVDANLRAFNWGRLAAHDMDTVQKQMEQELVQDPDHVPSESLADKIQRRYDFLEAYQDKRYADRYQAMLLEVKQAESKAGVTGVLDVVAQSYFRLMAIKDEYEVARLYTDGNFERRLKAQFEGDYKLQFYLAPPLLSKRDPKTGHLQKRTFGPWVFQAFKLLKRLKGLRGTWLDIFGYLPERRAERKLLADFEVMLRRDILPHLRSDNVGRACEIVRLSQDIRGFGHVKEANMEKVLQQQQQLLRDYV